MSEGTIALWLKLDEAPRDARILGQIPLDEKLIAKAATVGTQESKFVDIILEGEGEALTVATKAIITRLPSLGQLCQVPSLERIPPQLVSS